MYYVQTFRVVRSQQLATFPVDMLRYDSCWPATSKDATSIDRQSDAEQIISGEADLDLDEDITLCRIVKSKDDRPTVDRWNSFGYIVVPQSVNTVSWWRRDE